MKLGTGRYAAIGSLAFCLLLVSGVAFAQGLYGSNVTASTSNNVTVSSSGTASVDNSATTGVTATLSGLSGVSNAVVTTSTLSGPSSGVNTFSTSGTPLYFDLSVSLPAGTTAPAGATVNVCFSSPSVASSDTLYYWSSGAWVSATSVTVNTSTNTICGTVPLSALTGTNFVAAPPGTSYTWLYILVVVVIVIVIAVAVVMMRRPKKSP